MSEYGVKHSLTHIGKFRSPGDNGLLSTFSCLRTDFLHSLGRRGECNVRAYLSITPLNPSIHIQILQTKRHAISNLPGERRSKKWLTKRHKPPPLPPWKALFLSDKIIGMKKIEFRSWTSLLRVIFVIIFIPLCETTTIRSSIRASLSYRTPGSRLPYSEPYPFLPKLITILLFVAVVPEPVHVCPKGVWHDGWRNWV